jgi:hypothetical protein
MVRRSSVGVWVVGGGTCGGLAGVGVWVRGKDSQGPEAKGSLLPKSRKAAEAQVFVPAGQKARVAPVGTLVPAQLAKRDLGSHLTSSAGRPFGPF